MKPIPLHSYARQRRGVAVLLVLGILAATLVVAYAVLRVQTTSSFVEFNMQRQVDARSAALIGMNVALRKIHGSSWSGVGSTLNGTVEDGVTYTVRFQAGDSRLTSSDPEYVQNPYRVTIQSTGTATTSGFSESPSTYTVESVVQLIPRAIQSTPSDWDRLTDYTVFQWSGETVLFELPAQLAGPVHIQGPLSFAPSYPIDSQDVFSGYVDEVAIYNKAISGNDILSIYLARLGLLGDSPITRYISQGPLAYWRLNDGSNAATAADRQGNYPGEYVSAKSGQSPIPFSGAGTSAYFDGLTDSIHCGSINPGGSRLTILAWFNASSFASSKRCLVGSSRGSSDSDQLWTLGTYQAGGLNGLYFILRANNSTRIANATSLTLTPNSWHFVAATYDGNKIRIYLNGLELDEESASGTIDSYSNAFVSIGDWTPGSPRSRLLNDYYAMYQDGVADYRPTSLTWHAPASKISTANQKLLGDDLKVTFSSVPVNTSAPVTFPVSAPSYQLYTGGPVYSVPAVSDPISNVKLGPDYTTNPLGIYQCKSNLRFRGNVVVEGTLVLSESAFNDVELEDDSLSWTPVDLPLIDGESVPRQLPILIVPGRLKVKAESGGNSLQGMVVAGNELEFESGDNDMALQIRGKLAAAEIDLEQRTNWTTSSANWRTMTRDFLVQRAQPNGIPYFPQWLAETYGYSAAPQLSVAPDEENPIYHWPDFSRPLFEPHPDDEGLRWKIVGWFDGVE